MNKSVRDTTADLLKGIAVILMIQVHLVELFAVPGLMNSPAGKFLLFLGGPPAAPVFMVVMGYFLFHSHKSTTELIIRGIKLFAGGLLLNIGLNLHLLISIYDENIDVSPWKFIFGSDILPLAGLSIIIIALSRKYFNTKPYLLLIAGVIILLLTPILPDIYEDPLSPAAFIQAFFWGNLEWSYFPLFPWLFYPLAGYGFGLFKSAIDKILLKEIITYSATALGLIILIFTWEYGLDISSNLPAYYHHGFLFALWTVLFLSFYIYLIHLLDKHFRREQLNLYLRWVGKNVTAFYVFQWLIIGNIATAVYKTQNGIQIILWFMAVLIATTLLVLIYNRSRELSVLKKYTG